MLLAITLAAALTQPPVEIESCSYRIYGGYDHFSGPATVRFTNIASVDADVIRFRIVFSRSRYVVHVLDVGRFAPNVTIVHSFRDTKNYTVDSFSNEAADCAVERVHFVDGRTWTAHFTS